jgi:GT2 family glycosyltransferase
MDPKASRSARTAADTAVRVSAIVVAHDSAAAQPLELCLRAALADPWVDELVLVDAGQSPELASRLRGLKADRRDIVLIGAPGSAAEARNRGAAAARGRWLLFLDPALVMQAGAVARLVSAGRTAASPWIVGGKVLDAKGRERGEARGPAPTLQSAFADALGMARRPAPFGDRAAPVGVVGGAMMLIPRDDFVGLGGFQNAALEPLEAFDLCQRAAAAGGEVRFAPRAEGVQIAPARRGGRGRSMTRLLGRNARGPMERFGVALSAPALQALWGFRQAVAALFRRRR